MNMKIYIECSGGLVRRVLATDKDAEVELVDYDVFEDTFPDKKELARARKMEDEVSRGITNGVLHVLY